jgi:hypothetical protein
MTLKDIRDLNDDVMVLYDGINHHYIEKEDFNEGSKYMNLSQIRNDVEFVELRRKDSSNRVGYKIRFFRTYRSKGKNYTVYLSHDKKTIWNFLHKYNNWYISDNFVPATDENKEKFYLLVAGSRGFNDYPLLKEKLDYLLQNQLDKEIHIVSGGAKGADTMAEWYAKKRGYQMHVFPADWDRFGKSAGYRRNKQMHQFISQFPKRGCVCFWDGESKGTQHNFQLCETYGTPLRKILFQPNSLGL